MALLAEESIEELSASLVREYLNRKGLKSTLRKLDEELLRTSGSISNRSALAKAVKIEKLMKQNKELATPYRSMIEVIVKYLTSIQPQAKFPSTAVTERPQSATITTDIGKPITSTSTLTSLSDTPLQPVPCTASSDKASIAVSSLNKLYTDNSSEGVYSGSDLKLAVSSGQSIQAAVMSKNISGTKKHTRSPRQGVKTKEGAIAVRTRSPGAKSKRSKQKMARGESDESSGQQVRWSPGTSPLMALNPTAPSTSSMGVEVTSDDTDFSSQATPLPPSSSVSPPTTSVVSSVATGEDNNMTFEDLEDFDLNVDVGMPRTTELGAGRGARVGFPQGKSISPKLAKSLRLILFGDSSVSFNSEWTQQALVFCDLPNLKYGLIQRKGGPCGTLASLQAHIIKHLLFKGEEDKLPMTQARLQPSVETRQKALAASIAEILWRAGECKSAIVALSKGGVSRTTSYKQVDVIAGLNMVSFEEEQLMKVFIEENLATFMDESACGCILFTASVILSRGIARIQLDMDEPSSHLIGAHGYCTQELVNLILTGRATSNVFDGTVSLGSGSTNEKSVLKGIREKPEIGFLSLFEHYKSCEVGKYYKNPCYPVYVVCSESHFLVLFGTDKAITDQRGVEGEFDLFYYDGLANQQEEIRLTISKCGEAPKTGHRGSDLTPPIEHCIRTRWKDCLVNWNGTEKLL